MQLDQFISESLVEIHRAIEAAQKTASVSVGVGWAGQGGIAPPNFVIDTNKTDQLLIVVEFDIAVTVDDSKETRTGIGAALSVIGVGMQAKDRSAESQVSRIHFSVPIRLPTNEHDRT